MTTELNSTAAEVGSLDPAASAAIAPIAFVTPSVRETLVQLTYPIESGGRIIDRVMIRRLTVAQVANFMMELKALQKVDAEATARWPMYCDINGDVMPDAVIDALDDDDGSAIEEIISDFLPRRFRASPAARDTAPVNGEAIEHSLLGPSVGP
jgi:hypothetical protein